jgi:hypothetical protein
MTLALKQITWLDGTVLPDDYDVTDDGEMVGRIHLIDADRELWRWMIPGSGGRPRARTAAWPIASLRRRRRSAGPGTRTSRTARLFHGPACKTRDSVSYRKSPCTWLQA